EHFGQDTRLRLIPSRLCSAFWRRNHRDTCQSNATAGAMMKTPMTAAITRATPISMVPVPLGQSSIAAYQRSYLRESLRGHQRPAHPRTGERDLLAYLRFCHIAGAAGFGEALAEKAEICTHREYWLGRSAGCKRELLQPVTGLQPEASWI